MSAPANRQPEAPITGVILAGGQGTPMSGVDKGLQPGGGRKVAAWCADMGAIEVDFSDQSEAFGNFNTQDDQTRS